MGHQNIQGVHLGKVAGGIHDFCTTRSAQIAKGKEKENQGRGRESGSYFHLIKSNKSDRLIKQKRSEKKRNGSGQAGSKPDKERGKLGRKEK